MENIKDRVRTKCDTLKHQKLKDIILRSRYICSLRQLISLLQISWDSNDKVQQILAAEPQWVACPS